MCGRSSSIKVCRRLQHPEIVFQYQYFLLHPVAARVSRHQLAPASSWGGIILSCAVYDFAFIERVLAELIGNSNRGWASGRSAIR